MSKNEKKVLNKEQKPWVVVLYDEDGVDYVFFDTKEEADAKCDAQVALGYAAEVVDCKSAARRQAIEFVRDAAMRSRMTTPEDYSGHYDLWKLSGKAVFELGEADKQYVISVASKAVAEELNEEPEDGDEHDAEVEICEEYYNTRLHIASIVLEKVLEKSDKADMIDIAESLEEDGYGDVLTESEGEDIFGKPCMVRNLHVSKFAAAMARSLEDAVLESFDDNDEE